MTGTKSEQMDARRLVNYCMAGLVLLLIQHVQKLVAMALLLIYQLKSVMIIILSQMMAAPLVFLIQDIHVQENLQPVLLFAETE